MKKFKIYGSICYVTYIVEAETAEEALEKFDWEGGEVYSCEDADICGVPINLEAVEMEE